MPSRRRNNRRRIVRNISSKYHDILKGKKLRFINQWATPVYTSLNLSDRVSIFEISHMWKTGDRYYKLAEEYYGNSEYWWVIARYNKRPTESHLRKGDILLIPTPLEAVLEAI